MNAVAKKNLSRIQREKRGKIQKAALEVFSEYGLRSATLDKIATACGLTKPNILYYFDSKDKIHEMLLSNLLETWLEPLKQISSAGEPISEICCYVERKLEMARDFPQESRLFANEILQGAPRIFHALHGPLKKLTDEKVALINSWADDGKINSVDPYHLIFSIWAITQHYADFDVQILAVMEKNKIPNRFSDANKYLKELFTRLLEPKVKLKEPLP